MLPASVWTVSLEACAIAPAAAVTWTVPPATPPLPRTVTFPEAVKATLSPPASVILPLAAVIPAEMSRSEAAPPDWIRMLPVPPALTALLTATWPSVVASTIEPVLVAATVRPARAEPETAVGVPTPLAATALMVKPETEPTVTAVFSCRLMSPEAALSVRAAIVATSVMIGLTPAPRRPMPDADSRRAPLAYSKMSVCVAGGLGRCEVAPAAVKSETLPQLAWLVRAAGAALRSALRRASTTPSA